MLSRSTSPALELGLVARTVPDVLDAGMPEAISEGGKENEPSTPRGAMLPPVAREPPAIKSVSALSPNWERRNHLFDEGFVLSPVKTLNSPVEMSFVSSVWSEASRHG